MEKLDKFVGTSAFSLGLIADWLNEHLGVASVSEKNELVRKSLAHISVLQNLAAEILSDRQKAPGP